MGTSLNGLTPAGTYPGLIKTGDNAPIDGTLKTLSDGNGNNLPMSVSTTTINLTGTAQVGGVAIANTTQLAAKQDTLVSGTNIKTINGTSVLGSGNIVTPSTNPSGVAGAIQFSDGSAFASDAANLFWDDTNNRLGVGTNAPSVKYDQQGGGALFNMGGGGTNSFRVQRGGSTLLNVGTDNASIYLSADGGNNGNIQFTKLNGSLLMQISDIGTVATIKGVGSTSATTSLLVQNNAGTELARFNDDGSISLGSKTSISTIGTINTGGNVYALGGASVQVTAAGNFRFVTASQIWNDADGTLRLSNWADNGFDLLRLGGKTASFPALKRSTTNLQVRLADDSGYAPIDASLYKVGGTNGFTGTGSYTNFTIVGGIITNAS